MISNLILAFAFILALCVGILKLFVIVLVFVFVYVLVLRCVLRTSVIVPMKTERISDDKSIAFFWAWAIFDLKSSEPVPKSRLKSNSRTRSEEQKSNNNNIYSHNNNNDSNNNKQQHEQNKNNEKDGAFGKPKILYPCRSLYPPIVPYFITKLKTGLIYI